MQQGPAREVRERKEIGGQMSKEKEGGWRVDGKGRMSR